ncbi:MAG: HEPN domain-containing protein [Pseudomonadota bacterium]
MNPRLEEAEQLLAAGERDRTAFRILNRDSEAPNEIVLFHAQQAAEKFIKAALVTQGIVFRRTHDLLELWDVASKNGLAIPADRQLLVRLGPYAVEFRYLGVLAPEVSRAEAETLIESLSTWARQHVAGVR